jgi:predicted flap endonuclease-1-like 5' DNA nuclease
VLKGIGPKTGAQLREAGIVTFQDLAAYTADEIRQMLTDLPAFVDVESWVAQARQQVRTHRR